MVVLADDLDEMLTPRVEVMPVLHSRVAQDVRCCLLHPSPRRHLGTGVCAMVISPFTDTGRCYIRELVCYYTCLLPK